MAQSRKQALRPAPSFSSSLRGVCLCTTQFSFTPHPTYIANTIAIPLHDYG